MKLFIQRLRIFKFLIPIILFYACTKNDFNKNQDNINRQITDYYEIPKIINKDANVLKYGSIGLFIANNSFQNRFGRYRINYRLRNSGVHWKQLILDVTNDEVLLVGLESKKEYEFKVARILNQFSTTGFSESYIAEAN